MIINAYEFSFPVIGGYLEPDGTGKSKVTPQCLCGTAFTIGGPFLITAAHVIREVEKHSWSGIFVTKDQKNWIPINDDFETEVFEDVDIGIVRVSNLDCDPMRFRLAEMNMLQDVFAVGYPYSLDIQNKRMNIRSLRGHIVSPTTSYDLPGKPRVYELSFQAPRGLSGSPLIVYDDLPAIIGIVVGNLTTSMLVYQSQTEIEHIEEKKREIHVERFESFHCGVAVQISELGKLESRLLKGNVLGVIRKGGWVQKDRRTD